jgi:hypothetical protein
MLERTRKKICTFFLGEGEGIEEKGEGMRGRKECIAAPHFFNEGSFSGW